MNARAVIKTGEKEEKISELRSYEGEKYTTITSAEAGDIVAAKGLSELKNGAGLGFEEAFSENVLTPVMRYSLLLHDHEDPVTVMGYLKSLEDEEPSLKVMWDERLQELGVGLMGRVQAEILKSLLLERFGLDADFGRGSVLYKETILDRVEGVGHYEPLRHYAEVHLILEPAARNDGIILKNACREEILNKNFQRLVLTHLMEKEHLGVIGGYPLTDVKITLTAGRSHIKHTEGGDFREATYRAVRQGLMKARSVLLEPFYRFRLELPRESLSRALTDLRDMGCDPSEPWYTDETVVLSGRGPAAELNDYNPVLSSYTAGRGRLLLENDGYDRCHNEEEVRAGLAYIPEADLENSPDSVFCAHGAGFVVPWQDVEKYMHLESTLSGKPLKERDIKPREERKITATAEELEEIMLREFGPIKRPVYGERIVRTAPAEKTSAVRKETPPKPEMLIVDGYNVIFAWEELRSLASSDIQSARDKLMHILSNYAAFRRIETMLTGEELAIYRRGRNAHVHGVPKNATHGQYGKATGGDAEALT